jgi:hypothetical protein
MSMKNRTKKKLSEQEIDQIVIAQAHDDSAWGKPIHVRRKKLASGSVLALAARATVLAKRNANSYPQ